jgi:spore germination protein YaaH
MRRIVGIALLCLAIIIMASCSPIRSNSELACDSSISRYEVIGFLPYWVQGYQPKYDYLSHIAWFAVDVGQDGIVNNAYGWPPAKLVDEAHSHNVKVILTATCFAPDIIDSVLAYHQEELTHNLLGLVENGRGDGIVIDFEGIRTVNTYTGEYNDALLVEFMQNLNYEFKQENSDYYISMCVGAEDWNSVFDCSNLSSSLDSFFIMAYDYHWETSAVAGAVSPLRGNSMNVMSTLDYYLSQSNSEKFVLGLPLYGLQWHTHSGDRGSQTILYADNQVLTKTVMIDEAVRNARKYGYLWDEETETPWYRYEENGQWYQGWFDDVCSLRLKYRLALHNELRGIGFWALGYEGDYTEVYAAWCEEASGWAGIYD